jgi:hypothetical protein
MLSLGQPVADAHPPHSGANTMSHTPEQAAFLERFNQPELFLADVKNLNVQQSEREAVFTRPDGVEVHIWRHDKIMGKKGNYYIEDMTHPESPYSYHSTYNENGIPIYRTTRFYGTDLYRYECKDGKCVTSSFSNDSFINPLIPIAQTRAMLRKETGIDLYDRSIISRADYNYNDDKTMSYFLLIMRRLRREMLIDAATGKVLYEREFVPSREGSGSNPGTEEMEGSAAYVKSVKIVKKLMEKDQTVYGVYKKRGTRDPDRFYEILLQKQQLKNLSISIVSFLLDHEKGKILYRCETTIRLMGIHMPYIEFWDEYQQHLKMREAEEESGPLSDTRRK